MKYTFEIPQIVWLPILPMILVAVTGMAALVAQMMRKGSNNSGVVFTSVFGLAMALATSLGTVGKDFPAQFGGMVELTSLGNAAQIIVLISAILSILISSNYLPDKKITLGEVYPLLIWATLGSMMLCVSTNLLVIFIGIEILSISLYVLAGLSRGEERSEEAAMKYFLLGAFATGFLLYGIAFFYGATGSLELANFNSAWIGSKGENTGLLTISFALILIGLGFKCSLVPFHQWTPDVYSGAPTNVVAFMATVGKVGPFIVLANLAHLTTALNSNSVWLFAVLAVLTMVVGNVMAFIQTEIKKMMAYSSIANAGYVAVAITVMAKSAAGVGSTLAYYLLGYCLTTIGAFAVLAFSASQGKEAIKVSDLRGLLGRSPLAAGALAIFVLSLIGIGPVSGFVGKFLLVRDSVDTGLLWLAVVLVLNSIFGAYYYFGLLRAAFQPDECGASLEVKPSFVYQGTLLFCALAIIGMVVCYPFVIRLLWL